MDNTLLLRLLYRITLELDATDSLHYRADICIDGTVHYANPDTTGSCDIRKETGKDFVRCMSESLFIRNADVEGTPLNGPYHWKVCFFTRKGLSRTMEGWKDEPYERYCDFKSLLSYLEDLLDIDLGTFALEQYEEEKQNRHALAAAKKVYVLRNNYDTAAADSVINLSQKIFRGMLKQQNNKGNLLLSPISIEIILYLLMHAAHGKTREELSSYTCADSNEALKKLEVFLKSVTDDSSVSMANALYADEFTLPYVLPSFVDELKGTAAADILSPQDNVIGEINRWVRDKTSGVIPQLLSPGTPISNLAVLNAVLFEARWFDGYEDYDIEKGTFTALDGRTEKVDYLHSWENHLIYDDAAIGFLKPYRNSDYVFMGLLPRQTDDPSEYLSSLPDGALANLIHNAVEESVIVDMPEFSIEKDIDIKEMLKSEGVISAFDAKSADLSGMLSLPESFISDIVHKSKIRVDRHGTKAAAVTMTVACAGAAPAERRIFHVKLDRPFIFGIVHRTTGTPLFLGIVNTLENND